MEEIIKEFDKDESKFALEAVLEARKNKGKINDYLLNHLEDFLNNLDNNEEQIPISIMYSIYLLAEFEEKRLFPILMKLINTYDQFIKDEEGLIFSLSSIIVSVFDNDFDSLNNIIENKDIDSFIRGELLSCYIYFYNNNMISKQDLEKYLLKLIEVYDYETDDIYDSILNVIVDTHLFSMTNIVRDLYEFDLINPIVRGGYDDFIDDIFDYDNNLHEISKIEDVVKEMSGWFCFEHDESDMDNFKEMFSDKFEEFANQEFNKVLKPIGRNDLCPCGSGKKYKKCCIDKEKDYLPYQNLITASLSDYPKRKTDSTRFDLYDFYKEEYIEADKILYRALKNKRIPMFITRDYNKEDKIDLNYLREAFVKIKDIINKDNIKTLKEYDDKVSIHYSIFRFFQKYSDLLIKKIQNGDKKLLKELEDLINYFYDNFDIADDEYYFVGAKHSLYCLKKDYDEGIKYFTDTLKKCEDSLKYSIYDALFDIYMCKYDDINKLYDLVQKEEDLELREELEELVESYKYEDVYNYDDFDYDEY